MRSYFYDSNKFLDLQQLTDCAIANLVETSFIELRKTRTHHRQAYNGHEN